MDLDKEFVRVILRDGDKAFGLALDKGINENRLSDDVKIAWNYIVSHKKQYGALPSLEMVLGSCVNSKGQQIDLSAGMVDSIEALVDKILQRSTLYLIKEGVKSVDAHLIKRDAKAASEALNEVHTKLMRENLTSSKIETLFALGTKVIDHYDLIKGGGIGIPTPWPTMTNQTMGLWPEDLVLIVGRLGLGKSFSLLLLTHSAWVNDKRVLFCTTEMSRETIAARFFCIHLKIPYTDFTKGRLGGFVEKKMRDGISSLLKDQGIYIVGKGFDFTIDQLDASVGEAEADMLAVDGAYLIKNRGKDRQEQVASTFNDFKRIGINHEIVTAATTQFNRQAKNNQEDTIAIENVGITDVAGWNASVAFGMYQTADMYKDRIMGFKPLKIREGEPMTFTSNWDMMRMDFSEVGGSAQRDSSDTGANNAAPSNGGAFPDMSDSDDDNIPF